MKRGMALAVLSALLLSGCAPQTDVAGPGAERSGETNLQLEALQRAEQAGLLAQQEDDSLLLSKEEALALIDQEFDKAKYAVSMTDETLSVGADADGARGYYVVAVSDSSGKAIGKIAVDRENGERYNYLGDGVLEDYATFPLYDPEADTKPGWEGTYKGPVSILLEITQAEDETLSYRFSDGTHGTAAVTGETAKSADGDINFLLAGNIITVAGGGLTGNYTAQLSHSSDESQGS